MLGAENGKLFVNGGTLDYVRFGEGERTLVMIPGVGDGLKTVRGMALPFALLYRGLARDFTVCLFSRGNALPAHITTREMAAELAAALDRLGIRRTAAVGVSQGGMIAQWLAVDRPDLVERLVLTVTLGRQNETVRHVVGHWMELARRGDYRALMADSAEKSYSPERLRLMRPLYALLGGMGGPRSFARFLTQAEACLTHDAWQELPRIACPTLVIGGEEDRVVSAEASRELAARIPGAELVMLPGLGHALYEEDRDYPERVARFCRRPTSRNRERHV